VDRKANNVFGELTFAGKAGSELANNIKSFGGGQTLFAGLLSPNSAINAVVHAGLPEALRESFGAAVDEGIQNALAKEQNPQARANAEKLVKALNPTLKAGAIDAAVSLRGPGADKLYTLVAGIELKEGMGIEKTLRELMVQLPAAAQAKIKLDAEDAAGVKIHRLGPADETNADVRRVFGDNPFYVAFRKDALLLSAGPGSLEAIKAGLVAQPGAAPPLAVDVSVARVAPLSKEQKADPRTIAQKVFTGPSRDQDKVHFALEGGQALKLRFDMNGAVIRFLSMMDKESKESK
jgi:hypothetical protein